MTCPQVSMPQKTELNRMDIIIGYNRTQVHNSQTDKKTLQNVSHTKPQFKTEF